MSATKTDLLNRYLHAVKFWLPKVQQDDILAEVAEDIYSRIAEREAALAQPLSMDEFAGILKQRGSPIKVASGYFSEERLIGPAALVQYRLVLKIVLLWVMAPLAGLAVISVFVISPHPESAIFFRIAGETFRAVFMTIGIVTTLFALLDHYGKISEPDNWDPLKLPRVPASPETSARWNHLAGFVFGLVAVFFWIYWMGQRTEFLLPGGVHVVLGPVWKDFYRLVLVLTLGGSAVDLLSFLRPHRVLARSIARFCIDAAAVAIAGLTLASDSWFQIVGAGLSAEAITRIASGFDIGIRITLVSVAIVAVCDVAVEIRRVARASNRAIETYTANSI
jgi:hypothetical protein